MRAGPGRAATTVAIFTATWKARLHPRYGESAVRVSSQCDVLTNESSTLKLAARQIPSRSKCALPNICRLNLAPRCEKPCADAAVLFESHPWVDRALLRVRRPATVVRVRSLNCTCEPSW